MVASTNETSRYGLVLGKSFVVDDRGGNYASIFLREVHDTAAEVELPQDLLAAYAIAHEVGHLLLGPSCHTPRGLMKAHWQRADYKQMKEGWLYFSADQSRLLATVYGLLPAEDVSPSVEQKAIALPVK